MRSASSMTRDSSDASESDCVGMRNEHICPDYDRRYKKMRTLAWRRASTFEGVPTTTSGFSDSSDL